MARYRRMALQRSHRARRAAVQRRRTRRRRTAQGDAAAVVTQFYAADLNQHDYCRARGR